MFNLTRIPILGIIAMTAAAPLAAFAEDLPHGNWSRGDGKARVIVEPCGSDLCAINTWIKPGVKDEKVGDRLVMTVSQTSGGLWTGKAYDPQRQLTLKFTLQVDGERMTTKGCVLGGLLCKSMGWTRLDRG